MVHANITTPTHSASQLIEIFEECFWSEFNTRLQGSGDEPVYLPLDASCAWHRVVFTRDYYASALHEIAHWCIAGEGRRKLVDYGYWYAPDGRTASQQKAFEQVEVYPQALEWIFSEACGYRFRVSVDNLTQNLGAGTDFIDAVAQRARLLCRKGLPGRAHRFAVALSRHYRVTDYDCADRYQSKTLQDTCFPGHIAL